MVVPLGVGSSSPDDPIDFETPLHLMLTNVPASLPLYPATRYKTDPTITGLVCINNCVHITKDAQANQYAQGVNARITHKP